MATIEVYYCPMKTLHAYKVKKLVSVWLLLCALPSWLGLGRDNIYSIRASPVTLCGLRDTTPQSGC